MSSINILGIDTSTNNCFVALQSNNNIQEVSSSSPVERSEKILSMINDLLLRANLGLEDLTAIAFAAGPGSFTGLKIASCIVQGLSLAYQKPIIKISSLWALALQAALEQLDDSITIIPCMDAKMGQLYYGVYQYERNSGQKIPLPIQQDAIAKPEDIVVTNKNVLIVGDGVKIFSNKVKTTADLKINTKISSPKASNTVKLADYKYKMYGIVTSDADPIYIRTYD